VNHNKPGNHCNELRHSYFYRLNYFPYSFWDCHSVVYHKTWNLKLDRISCKTATFLFYLRWTIQVIKLRRLPADILKICYHQASDGRGCRWDWLMMFDASVNKNSVHWCFMAWSQWGDGNEPRIVQFLVQKNPVGVRNDQTLEVTELEFKS